MRILLILLVAASVAMGARITLKTDLGAGKYNASTASIWSGGVAPVDGDSVTINQQASGVDTIVFDYNVILGNNTGNYGHGLVVNATSETRYARVEIADGVKLTLRGYNVTSACAILNNRYGFIKGMPGCTVYVDAASGYQTIIDNRGILEMIGTAEKPVTFSGQCNWNNSVASESKSGANYNYNYDAGICVRALDNPWISNSTGTGLGSMGNSSVSFSSQIPATICQTEVLDTTQVTSEGKYCINYHNGIIYYYNKTATNSFTVSYKYLTYNGWGIQSVQNTTYNEAKFDYCRFEYMGGTTARQYGVENLYKYSTASAANRLAYLKNSTISFCTQFYTLGTCSGTAADPLLITGNTINHCKVSSTANAISLEETGDCQYITISNNTLNCQQAFLVGTPYQTKATITGLIIRKNTGICPSVLITSAYTSLYDCYFDSNTVTGFGAVLDARMFLNANGAVDHPFTIRDNNFSFGNRFGNFIGNFVFERNVVNTFLHHAIIGTTTEDIVSANGIIRNNLFFNSTSGVGSSGILETGYNHRTYFHNLIFTGNTIGRGCYALLSLGDSQDDNCRTAVTGLVVENNIVYQPSYEVVRNADDANELTKLQIKSFDNNIVYNPSIGTALNYNKQATFIKSATRYNFDATRNVKGVCLFDPSYTLPDATNRSLVFTYTSVTDQTLQWGGGTAVQIVLDNGTATAAAHVGGTAANAISGSLTDASKTWSTSLVTGTVPSCCWLYIYEGTGVGQTRMITNNTATVLTVAGAWTTLPSTDSKYVIIKTEVQLFDVGGTNYVRAGVYLSDLPTTSQTDENITIVKNNLTTNPNLVDATGSTANDHKVQAGSPALAAGIANSNLTTDYWGTTRNNPPAMGFYDHEPATLPVIKKPTGSNKKMSIGPNLAF